MEERAKELTYQAIAEHLGVSNGKAWILCNRNRHRQNTNESVKRYESRGRKSLWQGEEA
jgi:DNA-directed RNA polymerase specialized sigma24 family protein